MSEFDKPIESHINPIPQEAKVFVDTTAQTALEALGYSGYPRVEFGNGWKCDIRPGEQTTVIVDKESFGDETYKPEWRIRAFQHEIDAHYAKSKLQPESAQWHLDWNEEHEAAPLFLNILSDIAGNREIASKDAGARADWDDFYRSRLFPESDYRFKLDKETRQQTDQLMPRHIQLLYAMIREKMVPNEECTIDPDARAVLDQLGKFNGDFDIINFSTQPFKSQTEYLTRMEQMRIWRNVIWPRYLELYEADLIDRTPESTDGNQTQKSSDEGDAGNSQFQDDYSDYEENRHPGGKPNKASDDPSVSDQIKNAMDMIVGGAPKQPGETSDIRSNLRNPGSKVTDKKTDKPSSESADSPDKTKKPSALEQFAHEKGVDRNDLQTYLNLQRKVTSIIGDMHGVFEQFINERTTSKWRLSHQHAEGVLLDPDNLARTVIQMTTGNTEDMRPYMDYEQKEKEREMSGKLDFWLVMDCSGSMGADNKSRVAAESAVAVLEGLNDFNNTVTEQSRSLGYELDYDARTGVVAFGDEAVITKPLGKSLTVKERVNSVKDVLAASLGGTNDYLGLDVIIEQYQNDPEPTRKKVIVVVTDGGTSNQAELTKRLQSLSLIPGLSVYAIGIQDTNAEVSYAPNGQTILDVRELPDTLSKMVTRLFN